jgi:hypothetical protein
MLLQLHSACRAPSAALIPVDHSLIQRPAKRRLYGQFNRVIISRWRRTCPVVRCGCDRRRRRWPALAATARALVGAVPAAAARRWLIKDRARGAVERASSRELDAPIAARVRASGSSCRRSQRPAAQMRKCGEGGGRLLTWVVRVGDARVAPTRAAGDWAWAAPWTSVITACRTPRTASQSAAGALVRAASQARMWTSMQSAAAMCSRAWMTVMARRIQLRAS